MRYENDEITYTLILKNQDNNQEHSYTIQSTENAGTLVKFNTATDGNDTLDVKTTYDVTLKAVSDHTAYSNVNTTASTGLGSINWKTPNITIEKTGTMGPYYYYYDVTWSEATLDPTPADDNSVQYQYNVQLIVHDNLRDTDYVQESKKGTVDNLSILPVQLEFEVDRWETYSYYIKASVTIDASHGERSEGEYSEIGADFCRALANTKIFLAPLRPFRSKYEVAA